MQSHAIEPSLPGAGESVGAYTQLTQLQQVFPGTGEPQANGKSHWIERLIEATGSKLNCHTVQQPSVEEPKVEWDPDDYMSVEPEFEAVLRSTESHDLIPALSIAEIMTCEQAELYSPEAMHKQLLDSSNTCLLYTSPSPRDVEESRMPSSA